MVRQVWCKFQPIIALIPKPLLRLAVNNVPSQRVQKMKQVSDIIAVHSGSVLDSKKAVLWGIAAGEAVEEWSFQLGLVSVKYWSARISKNCRVVHLVTFTDTHTTHVLHLTSSYY